MTLIDCLGTHDPGAAHSSEPTSSKKGFYGTGKFPRQGINRPQALYIVARAYSRYGIGVAGFERALRSIERPSAVLVTSVMTYWYPGVERPSDRKKNAS